MLARRSLFAGLTTLTLAGCLAGAPAKAAGTEPNAELTAQVEALYPDLERLYRELHEFPELSNQEVATARRLADRLRRLGYSVETGIGGHGIVGVLKNGAGPTLLVRAEMDALPVEEKTGLPYASKATGKDRGGREVPVMHACGHDVHMTAWIGTATIAAARKASWRGTLIMMGQPAEELGTGAKAMIAAGVLERFGRPDFALALHDSVDIPAGTVSIRPGYVFANADSIDVVFHGRGSHGAAPQRGVDPIVMASRAVLAFQTLVSRETDPREAAVLTVGSFHAGTKHNIIPDETRLQLTVRSYTDDVRKHLLDGIERITRAEAQASNAPEAPEVRLVESTRASYNDPALTRRVEESLRRALGASRVVEGRPDLVAEDFGEIGRAGIPAVMFRVGAVPPRAFEAAKAGGAVIPSLHSATFAPDRDATLKTAILAEASAALDLLRAR